MLTNASGNWSASLLDSDKAFTSVLEACVEAGPSLCPIYENTTDLVSARVDKIINDVQILPVPVYNYTGPSTVIFGQVDYTVLMGQLFQTAYGPYSMGNIIAAGLVELEQGVSGDIIYSGSITSQEEQLATCTFNSSQPFVAGLAEVTSAIACGDVLINTTRTFAEAKDDYDENVGVSRFAPDLYSILAGTCS